MTDNMTREKLKMHHIQLKKRGHHALTEKRPHKGSTFAEILSIHIGNAIKKQRYEMGLTQEDVCEFLPVTQTTYANWEIGHRAPRLHYLYILAEIFGCNLNNLIPDSDTIWQAIEDQKE